MKNQKSKNFCGNVFILISAIIIVAFNLLVINANAQTYDPLAVQRINDLIDNNGLNATKNAPETWIWARWNNETPKQLTMLFLHSQNLTGTAVFEGLNTLEVLGLVINNISELNLINCSALRDLNCGSNYLFGIDLSNLSSLSGFNGFGQEVYLTLNESVHGEYSVNIELNNPTFWDDEITYSDGILTCTDNNIEAARFSVETGNPNFILQGYMYFSYSHLKIEENLFPNSLKAYYQNNNLYISGLKTGENICVFAPSGALVYQGIAIQEKQEINVADDNGIYIVRSGNEAVKVIVMRNTK
ncbi:MAG: hypothetical protein FWH18_06555 [Marinilabiliaceae bacterium]|nr:hypothetical protein [Marinilabiliaceae bacterium]